MNNKFLVSAIAVAMAGSMSFANADVSVYGQTNVSIDATDSDGGSDDVNMESNTAAFGIKGSEKISDGLKAVFKYELQTDISQADGKNDGLIGRDQYLGLQGNFGRVLFGTTSTAYKSPGSKIDPWYRTSIQSRSIGLQSNLHSGKGEEGAGRGQNMIRYDSPKFAGGVGFTATYQLDNSEADGEDEDPYSLGVTYGGNGFYGFASYIDTQGADDTAAFQVGGKYSVSGFTVRAIYEVDQGLITDGRSTGTSMEDGADIWSIGVDYKLANNLISFDYGEQTDGNLGRDGLTGAVGVDANADGFDDNLDDVNEATTWRLGVQHMFSKRTKAYIGHANHDDDVTGESEVTTLGMSHKF